MFGDRELLSSDVDMLTLRHLWDRLRYVLGKIQQAIACLQTWEFQSLGRCFKDSPLKDLKGLT